jgi:hypothetical protein
MSESSFLLILEDHPLDMMARTSPTTQQRKYCCIRAEEKPHTLQDSFDDALCHTPRVGNNDTAKPDIDNRFAVCPGLVHPLSKRRRRCPVMIWVVQEPTKTRCV